MGRKAAAKVEEEEDVYEIKSILQYENRRGADYYLVEWDGYSLSEATWEPRSNFLNPSPEIALRLQQLKEAHQNKQKRTSVSSNHASGLSKAVASGPSGTRRSLNGVSPAATGSAAASTGRPRKAVAVSAPGTGKHSAAGRKRATTSSSRDTESKRKRKSTLEFGSSSRHSHGTMDDFVEIGGRDSIPENEFNGDQDGVAHSEEENGYDEELQKGPTDTDDVEELQNTTTLNGNHTGGSPSDQHRDSTDGGLRTALRGPLRPSSSPSFIDSTGEKSQGDTCGFLHEGSATPTQRGHSSSGPAASPKMLDGATHFNTSRSDGPGTASKLKDQQVPQPQSSAPVKTGGATVRVKSLRQDSTHGLCGIITVTSPTGAVEESRIPISEVRSRYPDELIEFLLMRIQFRSVRSSSIGAAPPATAPPVAPTVSEGMDSVSAGGL